MKRSLQSLRYKISRIRIPSGPFRRSQSFHSSYSGYTPSITSTATPTVHEDDDIDDDAFQAIHADEPLIYIPCESCHQSILIADFPRHQISCHRITDRPQNRHASPHITSSGRRRRAVSDDVSPSPSAPPRARSPSPTDGVTPPADLVCPITGQLFGDPVIATDGHTYEKFAIKRWLRSSTTSPTTREPLDKNQLIPNFVVKKMCDEFRAECQRQKLLPKYTLGIHVKKTEMAPLLQTETKAIYRAEWTSTSPSPADSNIVLVHLTGDHAAKIGDLYTRPPVHPHVVRVLGKVQHPDDGILLLQEFPPAKTLLQVMKDNHQMLSLRTCDLTLYQLISALEHLANEKFTYQHVTANSVLIYHLDGTAENTLVKLDTIESTEDLISRIPPEVLLKENYSEKAYVYGFGLLAQKLYSLELNVDEADLTLRQTLYKSCLVETATDRPTFTALIKSFQNLMGQAEDMFQSTSSD
ncbi:unnamed protein product [Adineta ricciae]|uniref:U-box domain-containing protein n=1 Tax=Adineta ricciae TaxID=249248 RepID=A0A814M712_ADIRI|nr:unnamed protein product [Adineta ricciae]CAF1075344.1 unnamed protein product [Adineta ricciae]